MHIKPAFFFVILSVACSGIDTPEGYPPDGYGGAILSTGARGGAPSSHGGSCGSGCSRGGTSGSSAGARAVGGSSQNPADSNSEAGAGLASAGTSASNGGAGSGSSGAGSTKGAGGAGKPAGAGGKPALAAGGNGAGGKGSAGAGGTGGRPGSELARGGGANNASAGGANNASGGDSANVAGGGTLGSNSGGGSTDSSGGDGSADEATPFFSEYVEGSGSFKALEIAANAAGDLSGCHLEIYANGAIKAWRTIELSGSVSREQVVVLCSPELAALLPVCLPSGALSFTGNDALVLSCSGTVVDAFGQIGNDPMGSGWGAPNRRTSDVTLRRLCEVEHGDTEPSDAFDPALEWSEASLDSFEDLGVFCAAP